MANIRTLTRSDHLDEALREAGARPVWIFKHSLTCGVSSAALEAYRRFAEARRNGDEILWMVEVQRARALSDEIARVTGIRHQTPQVLLLIEERVAWHGSHWAINYEALRSAMPLATPVGQDGSG